MSDMRWFTRAVPCVALLANGLLGACGLTGDLYLPDAAAPEPASSAVQPQSPANAGSVDGMPTASGDDSDSEDADAEAEQE